MIEHYSVSELSDGQNQMHTLLFPEQVGTYEEHRILTMADRFKQVLFRYLDYVTIRYIPFLASLNSNGCSSPSHFSQKNAQRSPKQMREMILFGDLLKEMS